MVMANPNKISYSADCDLGHFEQMLVPQGASEQFYLEL